MKRYRYVGHQDIEQALSSESNRIQITNSQQVIDWIQKNRPPINPDETITLTFIVDSESFLWITDRHSEHVLCANGRDVLSAGEITFEITKNTIEIIAITNQSTGYCPEPQSFSAVEEALSKIHILHPSNFTTIYQFRLCTNCGTTNIIKDDWYVCAVCDFELSKIWNF